MPRPKLWTKEEMLEKKRLYERKRKERIKGNAVTREEYLKKDRERYARKKESGLIVSRQQMTPKELEIVREKNRVSSLACYYRKKNREASAPTVNQAQCDETIGNLVEDDLFLPFKSIQSDGDNTSHNTGLLTSHLNTPSSRATRCNTLRRSLRSSSKSSISTNIKLELTSDREYTSSPEQTRLSTNHFVLVNNSNNPGPSNSQQDDPLSSVIPSYHSVLRRCSDSSLSTDIQHDVDENAQTSGHCVEPQQITHPTTGSPQRTCPNSLVLESKLITELQTKLLQVTREKEMFKNRCIRLQNYITLKANTRKEKRENVKPNKNIDPILPKVVNILKKMKIKRLVLEKMTPYEDMD